MRKTELFDEVCVSEDKRKGGCGCYIEGLKIELRGLTYVICSSDR